ncbi:MAG: NUDIX hydrolase [Candidatus Woesearchaeota archaeon]|jgi:ADP-ribose pyrophosphatase|nr:NUDIX hydrolase [Candidatus Woesearchaeota archaeon]MDP7457850.1 NUDIX hydrolase [Candidatus Woesearchaeota archaeon]
MKKWECKKSERILDTPHFKVRKDVVELPNKEMKEWTYWDSNDSVMVLAMTDNKLVMIRQYRYLVNDDVIEFPSGGLHDNESMEEGAKREFEEETGYKCGDLTLAKDNKIVAMGSSLAILLLKEKIGKGEIVV